MNHHHYQDNQNSRVRHVPIHVERRDGNSDDETSRFNHSYPDDRSQNHNQTLPHQFEQSHCDSRPSRSANTSNVDINYESPHQRARQQRQQNSPAPKPNPRNDQDNDQSTPMDGVQSDAHANQDKENSERTTRSISRARQQQQQQHQQQQHQESNPQDPQNAIPLPPPPEHTGPPKNDKTGFKQAQKEEVDEAPRQESPEGQQQQQQPQEGIEVKPTKKIMGPLEIIERTRDEVNGLLKEIASCVETSQTSKEYRRLDELLTRCVLKLDNIDCSEHPELRPQRKAIIAMIDKCTDILKRKVSLNHDIQQMTAKSPS